ncbi:hypothetical protein GCM10027346_41560 [Hymenobacter seoulensis]
MGSPLACQAQTDVEVAAPVAAETLPAPAFHAATLFKLGTGITRGLTLGGYRGTALPLVVGVERQVTPAWSVYGNVSSGWRIGVRMAAPERVTRLVYLTELGVDLGVRRYYHQDKRWAAGRDNRPLVGNYLALQATTSLTPAYGTKLSHQVTALSALWGMQRRLGGYGLLDAYVGPGLETRRLGMRHQGLTVRPHLQVGIKLSLVR